MRVLILEDDPKIAGFIAKGLRESGYTVDVVHDGIEGERMATQTDYDAAVVDIMLPGADGLSVIDEMRRQKVRTPVLILSAKRSVDDRVKGLRAGGDDYMTKPFSFSELEARIEALIRRSTSSGSAEPEVLRIADLELDPWKREARRDGQEIPLQAREFSLLEHMMRNVGRVITKTAILEHVYEYNFDPQTNVVDVLVHRLRRKIDHDFESKLIHTIRGVGYVLKADD